MRGHCWKVEGDWDGKQYKHDCEDGEFVHGGAMNTRRLWAAWRDRGAVARVLAEQAQGVEPVAWIVLDEDKVPIMCAPARQMCNDHINDAINDFDIAEASKWVVRKFVQTPSPPPLVEPKDATSPTTGMTIEQRILHVGGRNNEAGYVEFGSVQAVKALVHHVLRDLPDTKPTGDHVPEAAFGNTERTELIDCLREHASFKCIEGNEKRMVLKAADMLEADAQEIAATVRQVEILSDELSKCSKAQQVAVPYDQQALELCLECGWKAIMPGEPCLLCSKDAQQVAVPAWTLTADKMPEPCVNVLAHHGKKQPIRAQWVPAKTLVDNGDGDFGEYDDATDECYWPEAWYETNAHEETHWMVDEPVTHWMPLPAVPQGGKLVTKKDSKTDWSAA